MQCLPPSGTRLYYTLYNIIFFIKLYHIKHSLPPSTSPYPPLSLPPSSCGMSGCWSSIIFAGASAAVTVTAACCRTWSTALTSLSEGVGVWGEQACTGSQNPREGGRSRKGGTLREGGLGGPGGKWDELATPPHPANARLSALPFQIPLAPLQIAVPRTGGSRGPRGATEPSRCQWCGVGGDSSSRSSSSRSNAAAARAVRSLCIHVPTRTRSLVQAKSWIIFPGEQYRKHRVPTKYFTMMRNRQDSNLRGETPIDF